MTATPVRGVALELAVRALDEIEAALGPDVVHRSQEALRDFRDPYRYAGAPTAGPAGLVMPASTEQVQEIVRIAGRHGVPVWTSSQARNYGYGGAEPRLAGSIALSLRRMNRVLEINAELGYAVVEAGVTFFDLYEAVRGGGHPYWISCPDLGWGSVVGNALEHGLGYTPMGDHPAQLCGMEVVLPDGELLRTGMGGITGSPNRFVHKRGFGPSIDGLFTQSNFGIVTTVGVWLMPEPQVYSPGAIVVPHEEDLVPLVDTLRPLMMDGTIQGYPMIVHGLGPLVIAIPREYWPPITGIGTEEDLTPPLTAMGLGMWISRLALYGREDVVASNRARIQEAFEAVPGARVHFTEYRAPFTSDTVALPDQVPAGIPNMEVLNFVNPFGGREHGGHLDFSPVTPMTGRDAMAVFQALKRAYREHDVQAVYSPILRDRSLIHVNMIGFDTREAEQVDAANSAVRSLIGTIHRLGYGEYRSHQDFADAVADGYDFGDGALRRFHRLLKDAVDPKGILSPGKQGIWGSSASRAATEGTW